MTRPLSVYNPSIAYHSPICIFLWWYQLDENYR